MNALTLATDALAAHRLTRLVTRDTVTAPLRARLPRETRAGELVRCGWCTGVWVAAGVTLARRTAPRFWGPLAMMLATADAVGLVDQAATNCWGIDLIDDAKRWWRERARTGTVS